MFQTYPFYPTHPVLLPDQRSKIKIYNKISLPVWDFLAFHKQTYSICFLKYVETLKNPFKSFYFGWYFTQEQLHQSSINLLCIILIVNCHFCAKLCHIIIIISGFWMKFNPNWTKVLHFTTYVTTNVLKWYSLVVTGKRTLAQSHIRSDPHKVTSVYQHGQACCYISDLISDRR